MLPSFAQASTRNGSTSWARKILRFACAVRRNILSVAALSCSGQAALRQLQARQCQRMYLCRRTIVHGSRSGWTVCAHAFTARHVENVKDVLAAQLSHVMISVARFRLPLWTFRSCGWLWTRGVPIQTGRFQKRQEAKLWQFEGLCRKPKRRWWVSLRPENVEVRRHPASLDKILELAHPACLERCDGMLLVFDIGFIGCYWILLMLVAAAGCMYGRLGYAVNVQCRMKAAANQRNQCQFASICRVSHGHM